MDEDVLAKSLRQLRQAPSERRLGRESQWPELQWPEPQEEDLQETLLSLHEAYADEDEVPEHLERLARRIGDAYLGLEDLGGRPGRRSPTDN